MVAKLRALVSRGRVALVAGGLVTIFRRRCPRCGCEAEPCRR